MLFSKFELLQNKALYSNSLCANSNPSNQAHFNLSQSGFHGSTVFKNARSSIRKMQRLLLEDGHQNQ